MHSLTTLLLAFSALSSTVAADTKSQGEKLFNAHCAICHGIGGTGGRGPDLRIQPFTRVRTDEELFAAIREGLRGTEMPGAWSIDRDKTSLVIGYVRSLGEAAPAPVAGNPERGRTLYEAADCSQCHIIGGAGRGLGPELTNVGSRRGADYLRRAVARAGADVPQEYLFVQAQTIEGRRIEGIQINEDAFTVQLRDFEGTLHSFRREQLRSFRVLNGRSLMPDYAGKFTSDELDDVVAYLASLKRSE